MTSHKRNYSLQFVGSMTTTTTTTKTCVGVLFFVLLFFSSPSSVVPFKAGHVEPVPGSTVMRKGPSSSSNHSISNSRAAILEKLNAPRRGATGFSQDINSSLNASPPTGFYSNSQSTEKSLERNTFIRFPTIASPSSGTAPPSISPTTRSVVHSTEKRYHYRRPKPEKKQKISSLVTSDILAREEPSSLFTVGDEDVDFGSSMYYTTGSDATMSSVDIERYSQEHDLYGKQSATSVNKVVASSSASPAVAAKTNHDKDGDRFADKKSNSSNNKNKNIQPTSTVPSTLSKPTLLPANYLSLATFRHIDGTLEKSSSNILSRIANFWKNLGGRNSTSGMITYNNSINNSSSTSITNNNNDIHHNSKASKSSINTSSANNNAITSTKEEDEEDAYIDFNSDMDLSSSIDFDYSDNDASLNDHNMNRSSHNHQHHHENHDANRNHHHRNHHHPLDQVGTNKLNKGRSESLQPSKYISIEDTSGKRISNSKQQYLSLDDDENEEDHAIGSTNSATAVHHRGNSGNDNPQRDHDPRLHHQNQQHTTSVEDYLTSEISAGDFENYSDMSGGGSHSFHDDLFHTTTTGTITAVIEKKDKRNHQDLMSSGTSRKQHVLGKASGENSAQATSTPPRPPFSSGPSGTSSSVITKGDVRRAESDKVWSIDSHFGRNDLIESVEDEENEYYHGMTIGGFLKRELWTIPLFVLASLNMILIILFEVYVLCRARGQSRRHLFLGQMLLFGLFLCSFLALMFAVHPSIVGCFVGRLGVGITYSLIFSVLMVKCVFLLSLDAGIYLPTSYQGILLFFAVMVQVAIDTQWVIMYPPFLQTVESGRSMLLQCGTSFVQLLYSLSYVGFLVLMVGFLAGRAAYKGVVENFRESVYILITAVVTIPVALSWTVAGWMLQGRHQDACVSFGLVAHSLTTFLIMFMPKGRQLASLDKEAVCFEDQEDQCSGYSPSFFHFKPSTKNYKTTLWGDGNLYTTLEPTVSTINPNVFFHRNDFHSGMIY